MEIFLPVFKRHEAKRSAIKGRYKASNLMLAIQYWKLLLVGITAVKKWTVLETIRCVLCALFHCRDKRMNTLLEQATF